jgi:hypothetical protein
VGQRLGEEFFTFERVTENFLGAGVEFGCHGRGSCVRGCGRSNGRDRGEGFVARGAGKGWGMRISTTDGEGGCRSAKLELLVNLRDRSREYASVRWRPTLIAQTKGNVALV